MSASNSFETSILELIFKNTAFANIGDAGGLLPSATAGSLYISLHTADPGEAGNQQTSEANYTSYARVGVARSASGWTVSGNAVTNAAAITFPKCTGGSSTVTYFGVGTASSGSGVLLFSGALTSSLEVSNNITPQVAIGDLSISND